MIDRGSGSPASLEEILARWIARGRAAEEAARQHGALNPADAADEEIAREHAWVRDAMDCGIPRLLTRARFERSQQSPSMTAALDYLTAHPEGPDASECDRGRALVLLGDTGVGKSWAGCCLLRRLWERKRPSAFYYWPHLAQRLRGYQTRADTWERVRTMPTLMLDDVGPWRGAEAGFTESCLDELIYHREGNRQATIMTANLRIPQLQALVGDRAWDRLVGWARLHQSVGPSLR